MSEFRSKFYKAKRHLDNTRVMLVFILSGILLFSALLFFEFRRTSKKLENEIIGFVTYKSKSIKRKPDSTVVWEDADYKEPLGRKDTVRSDESSSAVLTLVDGTELRMDENSMVVLDISAKTKSIEFLYGSIQANRTLSNESSIEIQSGDLKLNLKEGDYSLRKKENGDVEIYISRGETLIQKNKKEFFLKEAFFAIFGKSEEPEIVEAYAKLTFPENLKFFLSEKDTLDIPFTWSAKQETSRIQFSAKQDFSVLYKEQIVQGGEFKTSLPKGSYYWRIIPVDPKAAFHSQVRKFVILQDIPFSYRYPQKESSFLIQDNSVLVNFAWDNLEDIQKYTLEISKSSDFAEIFKKMDAEANILSVDFSEEGNYYFRIRALQKNSDFPEKISDIGNFSIKKQTSISAPVLLSPAGGKNSEPIEKVLFGWKNDPSYKSYSLNVAENKELTQGLRTEKTKNNYALIEKFKAGTEYFWKVEGFTMSGKSYSSEVRSFRTIEDKLNPVKDSKIIKEEKKEEIIPPKPEKKEETKSIDTAKTIPESKTVAPSGLSAPKSKKKSEVKYEEEE